MIGILEKWTEEKQQVINAYFSPNEDNIVLVLYDDGFLPDGVSSPYRILAHFSDEDEQEAGPLFANLLQVPELWEIRMFYDRAEIWDEGIKKAEIIYSDPIGDHCVKSVRWLMADGFNYKTDHYDKYGWLYCSDLYGEDAAVDITCYYAKDHSIVLTWNSQNSMITWMDHGRMIGVYNSVEDFLTDFCNRTFAADQTILFTDIGFAKSMSRLRMKRELANLSISKKLSGNEILILTNSDQIEQLEVLVRSLPEFQFHIGAKTLMSDKLMNMNQYGNVNLYPGITEDARIRLLDQCSYYLDINYYKEICDAVQEALKNGLMIMGYDTTMHHAEYILPEYVFKTDETDKMVNCLKSIYANKIQWEQSVKKQYMLLWDL